MRADYGGVRRLAVAVAVAVAAAAATLACRPIALAPRNAGKSSWTDGGRVDRFLPSRSPYHRITESPNHAAKYICGFDG